MKFLAAVFMTFSLSGCFYQSVTENQIRKSVVACYENAGIEKIKSAFDGDVVVKCNNGKVYNISGKIKESV